MSYVPSKVSEDGFRIVEKLCRSTALWCCLSLIGWEELPKLNRQPSGLEAAKGRLSIEIYKVPCHFVDRIAARHLDGKMDMCIGLQLSHHFVKFSGKSLLFVWN